MKTATKYSTHFDFLKTIVPFALAIMFLLVLDARGQDVAVNGVLKESVIVERGQHHRVVRNVTEEVSPDGVTTLQTNSFTELANGIHFWRDNQWLETREQFKLFPGGAAATEGPHQLILGPNINEGGSVDLLTLDGKRFLSNPMGLSFRDTVTGNTVLIAEVKDSIGQLVAPNVIIYPDAFTDFSGVLRYTYTAAGFEQDVIIYDEGFGQPEDYGLDPATTHLEMWTEFFDPPVPDKKQIQLAFDLVDEKLDFGVTVFGQGKAFMLEKGGDEIPTAKVWSRVEGRDFLIEAVPYRDMRPLLDKLKPQVNAKDPAKRVQRMAKVVKGSNRMVASLKPRAKTDKKIRQTASIKTGSMSREPAAVIDYSTITVSTNNYIFKGDSTYYIASSVTLGGTTTTFEGGSVLKYAPTNTAKLTIGSNVTWLATSYRPVTLTARDDHSVGEKIGSAALSGYYADIALDINSSVAATIQNLRIAQAKTAIAITGSSGHVASHVQMVNCQTGIKLTSTTLNLRNALMHNVLTNFNGSSSTGRVEHLTTNMGDSLNYNSNIVLNLTNSLVVAVTGGTTNYNGSAVTVLSSSSGVFTNVGAGYHYLVSGSMYRNSGVTTITPALAADLKKMTTYPPILRTTDFTTDTTLSPQAARDTDTPDLGYHYDPLDYCWNSLNLTNATLLLTNGVAVGTYGTFGTRLLYGAKFISEGKPTTLNRLVRYSAVQEQTNDWGSTGSSTVLSLFDLTNAPSVLPEARLRFTDVSFLADSINKRGLFEYHQYYFLGTATFIDCLLRGINLAWNTFYMTTDNRPMTVGLTNNFNQRATLSLTTYSGSQTTISNYNRNNLFLSSTVALANGNPSNSKFEIFDNLFDTVTLSSSGNTNGYNGYYGTTALSGGTGNVTLTSVDYQTGTLSMPLTEIDLGVLRESDPVGV